MSKFSVFPQFLHITKPFGKSDSKSKLMIIFLPCLDYNSSFSTVDKTNFFYEALKFIDDGDASVDANCTLTSIPVVCKLG